MNQTPGNGTAGDGRAGRAPHDRLRPPPEDDASAESSGRKARAPPTRSPTRRPRSPNSRMRACAPWLISTTCAKMCRADPPRRGGRQSPPWPDSGLPMIDSLDLALAHATADPATIVNGVEAVREQALGVLARLGFPRRDDRGTRFDPTRHEAVATSPTRHPGGHSRRGRPAGVWRRRPPAAARAGGGGQARLMANQELSPGPGRAKERRARTRSSVPTGSWPAPHPGRQLRPGGRGPVQGDLGGLRRPFRPADTAPIRRVRA